MAQGKDWLGWPHDSNIAAHGLAFWEEHVPVALLSLTSQLPSVVLSSATKPGVPRPEYVIILVSH